MPFIFCPQARPPVTPSAVSQHLRILRESGLVEREPSGRLVLYTTTELGERLL
ncbi:ArsR/SmtB family transcription factor [Amycolatopsis umgeniensis]|uniref:ArsR/SmtB family transcription factor n=1 Tax=Amycolatopsis umgeniensis TaxID=336628 RepID=UPI001C88024E|nr:ArsR family transcriptional regulator [Amycolatopsis umgeniensis]